MMGRLAVRIGDHPAEEAPRIADVVASGEDDPISCAMALFYANVVTTTKELE